MNKYICDKMSHKPVRRSSGQDLSPLLRICHAVYRLLRVLTLRNSGNLHMNKNHNTFISAADSTKKISHMKHINIMHKDLFHCKHVATKVEPYAKDIIYKVNLFNFIIVTCCNKKLVLSSHLYSLDLWGLDDRGLGSLDHPVHLDCLTVG